MVGICWSAVDDSTTIGAKVNACVDARVARDGGIGECVLVLIVMIRSHVNPASSDR
jgi:hypothetical protein